MKALEYLAGPARMKAPHWTCLPAALLAAMLFVVSAGFQLRAANSRWITHADGTGWSQYSIESHEFDYFLAEDPVVLIPDTSIPFGIGMFFQAAGLFLTLVALLALRPGNLRPRRMLHTLLGLCAVASAALIGYQSLRTGLDGKPFAPLAQSGIAGVAYLLGFVALAVLVVLAWRRTPVLGIALACSLSTTIVGYIFCSLFIAPVFAGDQSFDTTRGTETVMAAATAAAGLAMLLAFALYAGNAVRRARPAVQETSAP